MRVPRFSVRMLMVATAIVGLIIGSAVKLQRRSARFSDLSDYHRSQIHYVFSGPFDRDGEWIEEPSVFDQDMNPVTGTRRRKALWRLALVRKYELAARSPWFHVAPDPPEPKED
jgi:hypothetical protein